jgi:lysophospholipase L1-like esterase
MGQHPVGMAARLLERRGPAAAWLLAALALAAALLAACGDGDGGESGQNPGPSPETGGALRYVALGDSVAAGIGGSEGYVERYAEALQAGTGRDVTVTNLGRNGWTSGDLLDALRGDPRFEEALTGAQAVTWDIGGNDALAARGAYRRGACGGADNQDCLRAALERFKRNWDVILSEIEGLRADGDVLLLTMDVYNPFVTEDAARDSWAADGGLSDFDVFSGYLNEMNRHIAATASERGVPCARVSAAFNGPDGDEAPEEKGYLSPDGIHPSDAGHEAIAALLWELTRQTVA